MRAKKKSTRKHKLFRRVFITLLSLTLLVVVFYELTVRDRLELSIIAQIKTICAESINDAVDDYLSENNGIENSMITISNDENGNLKSITENVYTVNRFKVDVSDKSQKYINDVLRKHGIFVKLGNFSGLSLISDMGPDVYLDVDATATVNCKITNKFESAGMNQTLHYTILTIYSDVYVGNPIRIESIKYKTSFEISQSVIIGEIPSTYGSRSRYRE